MRGDELLNKMELVDPVYLEAAGKRPNRKKRSWLKYGVVAACLCVALLLLFSGMPDLTNTFFVSAYALEPASDGTVELKEADLMEQSDVWGGHFDGENFYVNVGFRYDGHNIRSVEFATETGFFAKQYIGNLVDGGSISKLYVGADNKLVMYGTDFEIVGELVTLNEETMTDDLLLFWGTQATEMSEVPKHIDIIATATFYDGRTQEVSIPIDLSGVGVTSSICNEEEIQRHMERIDYYKNLPLEKCELLEESVETVTDVYEVALGISTSWITIRDEMEFDEDGIWRGGTRSDFTETGLEIYIPVIKRDVSGVYTGMLYRVPKNLHYK